MQLAEKLNVTDRAVSKWENGRSMPDSSIMLNLCETLGITVNDLLYGEIVSMDNYNKDMEKKLIEMVKEKEENDKRLLMLEWVVGILSILILLIPVFIGAFVQAEDWQKLIIVFSGFIPAFVGFFCTLKIEQVAGYYECQKCGGKFQPTLAKYLIGPHTATTRYMRCPHCGEKSYCKKRLTK
jgi:transcriptional regulator with XRE-family HTH domain/DNA-directed RNA polymerase subunit RPC12/RpoP